MALTVSDAFLAVDSLDNHYLVASDLSRATVLGYGDWINFAGQGWTIVTDVGDVLLALLSSNPATGLSTGQQ